VQPYEFCHVIRHCSVAQRGHCHPCWRRSRFAVDELDEHAAAASWAWITSGAPVEKSNPCVLLPVCLLRDLVHQLALFCYGSCHPQARGLCHCPWQQPEPVSAIGLIYCCTPNHDRLPDSFLLVTLRMQPVHIPPPYRCQHDRHPNSPHLIRCLLQVLPMKVFLFPPPFHYMLLSLNPKMASIALPLPAVHSVSGIAHFRLSSPQYCWASVHSHARCAVPPRCVSPHCITWH
jgi:hypothetical protein